MSRSALRPIWRVCLPTRSSNMTHKYQKSKIRAPWRWCGRNYITTHPLSYIPLVPTKMTMIPRSNTSILMVLTMSVRNINKSWRKLTFLTEVVMGMFQGPLLCVPNWIKGRIRITPLWRYERENVFKKKQEKRWKYAVEISLFESIKWNYQNNQILISNIRALHKFYNWSNIEY